MECRAVARVGVAVLSRERNASVHHRPVGNGVRPNAGEVKHPAVVRFHPPGVARSNGNVATRAEGVLVLSSHSLVLIFWVLTVIGFRPPLC